MEIRENISKKLSDVRNTNQKQKLGNKIIKDKSRVEGIKEKQEQAIRLAIERQKSKANFKINKAKKLNHLKLKRSGQTVQSPFGNIGSSQSPIGNFGSSIIANQQTPKKIVKRKSKKKNKKTKTKTTRRRITKRQTQLQKPKFDILGI